MTFLHNSKIISTNRPKLNNASPKSEIVKPKQELSFAPKYFIIQK